MSCGFSTLPPRLSITASGFREHNYLSDCSISCVLPPLPVVTHPVARGLLQAQPPATPLTVKSRPQTECHGNEMETWKVTQYTTSYTHQQENGGCLAPELIQWQLVPLAVCCRAWHN